MSIALGLISALNKISCGGMHVSSQHSRQEGQKFKVISHRHRLKKQKRHTAVSQLDSPRFISLGMKSTFIEHLLCECHSRSPGGGEQRPHPALGAPSRLLQPQLAVHTSSHQAPTPLLACSANTGLASPPPQSCPLRQFSMMPGRATPRRVSSLGGREYKECWWGGGCPLAFIYTH